MWSSGSVVPFPPLHHYLPDCSFAFTPLPKQIKAKNNVPTIVIQVLAKFHTHIKTPGPEQLQNLSG